MKKPTKKSQRVCHDEPRDHLDRVATTKRPAFVPIAGSFAPPLGTLLVGVGRQPDGFTCGTETFIGVCEFLRLPSRDPDDDDIEDYKKKLKTSYKSGTDPADVAKVARDYLRIRGRVVEHLSIAELAKLMHGAQDYVAALIRGKPPNRPLSIAMVTYQAYVASDHDKSIYFPQGRRGRRIVQPIRASDGSILWENDWSDGHWSAVVRVVSRREGRALRAIRDQVGDHPRADEVLDGVVILADPSNGEGLSYVPIPEFEARWHDTDRNDRPRFRHAVVVLTVTVPVLRQMQDTARRAGVPMFATVAHNAVTYVP